MPYLTDSVIFELRRAWFTISLLIFDFRIDIFCSFHFLYTVACRFNLRTLHFFHSVVQNVKKIGFFKVLCKPRTTCNSSSNSNSLCVNSKTKTLITIPKFHISLLLGLIWQLSTNQTKYIEGCSKLSYFLAEVEYVKDSYRNGRNTASLQF